MTLSRSPADQLRQDLVHEWRTLRKMRSRMEDLGLGTDEIDGAIGLLSDAVHKALVASRDVYPDAPEEAILHWAWPYSVVTEGSPDGGPWDFRTLAVFRDIASAWDYLSDLEVRKGMVAFISMSDGKNWDPRLEWSVRT